MEKVLTVLDSGFWQAIILALVTALITRAFAVRGKLVWSVSHQHVYVMPRLDDHGSFPVQTQQIWFRNSGRQSIEALEIVLNWRPQHFEIWTPRQFEAASLPDGRLVISLPYLSGQEGFTLSMIDTFRDLSIVLNVRWKGGIGTNIPMAPQRIWPMWFNRLAALILLAGLTAILYVILQGVLTFIAHWDQLQAISPS